MPPAATEGESTNDIAALTFELSKTGGIPKGFPEGNRHRADGCKVLRLDGNVACIDSRRRTAAKGSGDPGPEAA